MIDIGIFKATLKVTQNPDIELLDSIRCSFEIATSALIQASVNLGILELNPTKREIQVVVEDLRKAITAIDIHKSKK